MTKALMVSDAAKCSSSADSLGFGYAEVGESVSSDTPSQEERMLIHLGTVAGYWCAGWVLLFLYEIASSSGHLAQDHVRRQTALGERDFSADRGSSVVSTPNDNSSRHEAESGFDVGTSQLIVPFRGNSVEWVLRFGTLAPRMAFESDADYAARRRAFRSEVFAFAPDKFDLRYEDENQTIALTLSPSFGCAQAQPMCNSPAFAIHRTKLVPRSRAGPAQWSKEDRPTASERGAVIATTRAWKQTQILAMDAELHDYREPLTFSLEAPRHLAKRMRSNVGVALVCMPKLEQLQPGNDPLVPEATSVRKELDGSFQFPDESTTYYVTLRVTLLQVWLFDRSTGAVYGRYTPRGVVVPRE